MSPIIDSIISLIIGVYFVYMLIVTIAMYYDMGNLRFSYYLIKYGLLIIISLTPVITHIFLGLEGKIYMFELVNIILRFLLYLFPWLDVINPSNFPLLDK